MSVARSRKENDMDELIQELRDLAECVELGEWEVPIGLYDALQAAAEELEKRRWVSFDERLPEDGQEILLGAPSYDHVVVTIYHELLGPGCTHTHWMSSPEGPEGK